MSIHAIREISQSVKVYLRALAVGLLLLAALWISSAAVHVPRIPVSEERIEKTTGKPDGETLYRVRIPELPGQPAPGGFCLIFKSIGNVVTVRSGGRVLYSYGQEYAETRRDIGRTYVSVLLPESADASPAGEGGTELEITLRASDSSASPDIRKLEICRAADATRYYLTNDTLGMLPALFFISIGLCCIGAGIILRGTWKLSLLSVCLGIVLQCMAIELLDTGGHYMALGINSHFWNILFYLDCYLIPVVSTLFSWELVRARFSRRENLVMQVGVLLNAGFGVAATLAVVVTPLRFCDFSGPYMGSLMVCAGFAAYGLYKIVQKKLLPHGSGLFILVLTVWLFLAILLNFSQDPLVNRGSRLRLDFETLEAAVVLYLAGGIFVRAVMKDSMEKQEEERRILQLERALNESRIRSFTNQMQPHFLYNTLSSIQELVLEDPPYASRMIGDFTTFLRGCIRSMADDRPIPFSQELLNIQSYTRIEEMRMEDRLRMCYEIEAEDFLILPLSIQPLVENAIRHGIYGRGPEGGTVRLHTWREGRTVCIEVSDDGVGFDTESVMRKIQQKDPGSYGLRNLIFRLERGMGAAVDIRSLVGTGTTVTIRMEQGSEPQGGEQSR